jgi:Zn-dependent M28 family amino/carboxypeptidase
VVDINIDMVGRIDSQHLDKKEYVYSIGSGKISKELYDLTEQVNKKYTELKLDYTYDDEKDPNQFYYRSDHYNFAEKGIPIVFFFNGVHPDYHRITDTIDKIDFPILAQRAKLGFYLAWEIANKEGRLK